MIESFDSTQGLCAAAEYDRYKLRLRTVDSTHGSSRFSLVIAQGI